MNRRWLHTLATLTLFWGCGDSGGGSAKQVTKQADAVRVAAERGTDLCAADSECPADNMCGTFCGNGWCGGICMAKDAAAPAGPECGADADCGQGRACNAFCGNGWCETLCTAGSAGSADPDPAWECQTAADCGSGRSCQIYCGNGWCSSVCTTDECSAASPCSGGRRCANGTCVDGDVLDSCETTQECADGLVCENKKCVFAAGEVGCTETDQCGSGETCVQRCGNGWCASLCEEQEDPLTACLKDCPSDCPAPEDWICGQSGLRYCDSCSAACYDDPVIACPIVNGPFAFAGYDFQAFSGTSVALLGTGYDSAGLDVSFAWTQVSGPVVTLDGAETDMAYFTAPDVASPTAFVFELRVTNSSSVSATDQVTVTISADEQVTTCMQRCGAACPAPEYWVCGLSGERYCNSCYAACYDDPVIACTSR